jgi:hypothetical protein
MSTIPDGKIVLVVDDDLNFRDPFITRLSDLLTELMPKGSHLEVLPAGAVEAYDAYISMLRDSGREKDLIYALLDLQIPVRRGEIPTTENGIVVLNKLRDLKVPTVVISNLPLAKRDFGPNQPVFISKNDLEDERKLKAQAVQIIDAIKDQPTVNLEDCKVLVSPIQERQRTRRLPLAVKSPAMLALHNRMPKAAREAAAVLAVGDPGVEFEQLAWLFFKEISSTGAGKYQYYPFDCESSGSPITLLQEARDGGEQHPRYLFIRNLHVLEACDLAEICDALAQSPAIRVGGDRAFLTVHRDKIIGTGARNGTERLLDLFCLAGFDDFILLEVPPLSATSTASGRPEDIRIYAEYYRLQRMEDKQESLIRFDERALNLITDFEYRRHFKDLSVFLDRLFRTKGGGVINSVFVRSMQPGDLVVDTASREVSKLILNTKAEEPSPGDSWSPGPLQEMCLQFLLLQRSGDEGSEELTIFSKDLEQIVGALESARNLDTDKDGSKRLQKTGTDLWPWNHYPICPRLLAQLRRHNLTVGLVPTAK